MKKQCAIPGCGCTIGEKGWGEYYDLRSGLRKRCSMQTYNRMQYCTAHAELSKHNATMQSHKRRKRVQKVYNKEMRTLIAALREENRIQAAKLIKLGVTLQ